MDISLITREVLAIRSDRRVEVILRLDDRQLTLQLSQRGRENTYRLLIPSLGRIECST